MRNALRYLLALVLIGTTLSPWPIVARAAVAAADGVVGDGTPESCTYAELIVEMNSPTYITFACGAAPFTLILEQPGGVQPLAGQNTTLDGGGLISLSAANVNDRRLFDVFPTAALTLTHITLFNATTASFAGGAIRNNGQLVLDDVVIHHTGAQGSLGGGAVYNESGTLLVRNSTLRDNYSAGGGALYNEPGAQITIENSTFLSNTVGDGQYGGAIFNSGLLTVTGGSFEGNELTLLGVCPSHCGGGAIANLASGTLTVSATSFYYNMTSESGGAIFNIGRLSLTDVVVSENTAVDYGGGIANFGAASMVTGGVISGNQAEWGGGFSNRSSSAASLSQVTIRDNHATTGPGGGLLSDYSTALLTDVTLSGNTSQLNGGAIASYYGVITITHATLSDNQSFYHGGGLWNFNNTATLTFVTVSGNTVGDTGGGIDGGSVTNFKNVILADNLPDNCGTISGSVSFSLSTDATCFSAVNGNQPSTPLLLGPLANNGGPTLTQLPPPGSAAIDNGQCIVGLNFDQRGLPRLVGGSCDVGAVERQADDYGWYLFLALAVR